MTIRNPPTDLQMPNLPFEIIQHIMGYAANPQSLRLRRDIETYILSKRRLYFIYNQFWTIHMGVQEPEYKYYITNDLISYINNDYGTKYGFEERFYRILSRNLRLTSDLDIDVYWNRLQTLSVDTQNNLLLGLLLPEERDDVIKTFP